MAITILEQPDLLAASGNPLRFAVRTDKSAIPGYQLSAKIYAGDSAGNLSEFPAMKLYPDDSGKSDIDISTLIHERIFPVFPDPVRNDFQKLAGFTIKYKIVFKETHKDGADSFESTIFTALKAKLPEGNTLLKFIQDQNYLTNFTAMEVVTDGTYYLTALFPAAATYFVKIQTIYADGRTENKEIGPVVVEESNDVYAIPVGPGSLNFTETPVSYSIWITDYTSTDTIFRKMTFRVRKPVKPSITMLYLNLSGGIDTLAVSEMTETLKTEKETGQDNKNFIRSFLTSCQDVFEVTTGYILPSAARRVKEFLISGRVYIALENKLCPVNVEKGSYNIFSENDDLQSVAFKYTFADPDYSLLGGSEVIRPEPGPDPEPEPDPDGTVIACCPDGKTNYFGIRTPAPFNIAYLFPYADGAKVIYAVDMIPVSGTLFSIGRAGLFYISFMYTGSGLLIRLLISQKTYMVYQDTQKNYFNKRVRLQLTAANISGTPSLTLLVNDVAEPLELFDTTDGNSMPAPDSDYFYLFQSGIAATPEFSESRLVSFGISNVTGQTVKDRVLWNFQGETDADKLKNRVSGGTAYDLSAKNIPDLGQVIKEIPFKY